MKTIDEKTAFLLKREHLMLLTKANIRWEEIYHGGPAVDGKRPYGSKSLEEDIFEILNWTPPPRPCSCGDPDCQENDFSEEERELARNFHKETLYALQICLQTQSFTPGLYIQNENGEWQSLKIENKIWP